MGSLIGEEVELQSWVTWILGEPWNSFLKETGRNLVGMMCFLGCYRSDGAERTSCRVDQIPEECCFPTERRLAEATGKKDKVVVVFVEVSGTIDLLVEGDGLDLRDPKVENSDWAKNQTEVELERWRLLAMRTVSALLLKWAL